MYKALAARNYGYDTSVAGDGANWPTKLGDGLWQFRLAELEIVGLKDDDGQPVPTISMDFNFCVSQSAVYTKKRECAYLPQHFVEFRQQTLDTYIAYFERSYNGNRAPLNIGHHFYNYQGGIYQQVLWAFARAVCGLPQVRCTTYSELAEFLAHKSQADLDALSTGQFPHLKPAVRLDTREAFKHEKALMAIVLDERSVRAEFVGPDPPREHDGRYEWTADGAQIKITAPTVPLTELPDKRSFKLEVRFVDKRGTELGREMRVIERDGGRLMEQLEAGE